MEKTLDKPQQILSIIDMYKKIYKIVFKYLVFFVIVLLSFFITKGLINTAYNSDQFLVNFGGELELKKNKLVQDFNTFSETSVKSKDISVYVLQGNLDIQDDFIESYNNLITYKGFVVPRYFYVYKTLPLADISTFQKDDYDPAALDTFIQNILVTKNKPIQQGNKRPSLPLSQGILGTFTLHCLFQNKIANQVCNYYTTNYLDTFFVYNITSDFDGFKTVFDKLVIKDSYKKHLCEALKKYVLYSNDNSNQIAGLFTDCGTEYQDWFYKFGFFIDIQKQLDNRYLTKDVYNDPLINAYKLVSFEQILYEDALGGRNSIDRLNMYIDFLDELMKKNNLDIFYVDLIYFFNNSYVTKWITDPDFYLKNKSAVDAITKRIDLLNYGNKLIGYNGLINNINNKRLIVQEEMLGTDNNGQYNGQYYVDLKKVIDDISFLNVIEKSISGNYISLRGIISIDLYEQTRLFTVNLELNYVDKLLFVSKVSIPEENDLTTFLNDILTRKTLTIAEFYYYISKNILLFDKNNSFVIDPASLCQEITSGLVLGEITTCNDSEIKITKPYSGSTVTYNIRHNNFVIKQLTVSSLDLQKALELYMNRIDRSQSSSMTDGNQLNFVKQIIDIINYVPVSKKNPNEVEGTSNSMLVIETIKKYLGVEVTDIVEKNGKFLVGFSLHGVNFLASYTLTNNILGPWYFKDITSNNIPTIIRNFSLSLDDGNKTNISIFVLDPLAYIKQVNPDAFELYEKFISK